MSVSNNKENKLSFSSANDGCEGRGKSSVTQFFCSRLVSGVGEDCRLLVITAPPAHLSLLLQWMMGHLCLSATGIAGPCLTRVLITPSGYKSSQSRERHMGQ